MTEQMLYGLALTGLPILLSLSIHEFAHARTALAFGDPTAKAMGRCTLNPLAHIHPIGTLMVVLVGFGWARPVPVNPMNLHPRRLGDIAVSAAGPASNLTLAVLCAIALRIAVSQGMRVNPTGAFTPSDLAAFLLVYTILINLMLCIFNLIPLFPLDGHHIGRETLPAHLRNGYMQWQVRYGMWVLMGLMFGPRLIEAVLNTRIDFNPLGWYIMHTRGQAREIMLDDRTWNVAREALLKFRGYTAIW